ncbi:transposase [Bacillota bacterium Lsc_1132]
MDKEIAKLMKGIPQTLTSVKGIGDVFGAGLIAEIGDSKSVKKNHKIQKNKKI